MTALILILFAFMAALAGLLLALSITLNKGDRRLADKIDVASNHIWRHLKAQNQKKVVLQIWHTPENDSWEWRVRHHNPDEYNYSVIDGGTEATYNAARLTALKAYRKHNEARLVPAAPNSIQVELP